MKPSKRKDFESAFAMDIVTCDTCPDWHIVFYDDKDRAFTQAVITEENLITLLKERGIFSRMKEH